MSEQDTPLEPWLRAALLAEGLDGGPAPDARARMAAKLAAAVGVPAAALLGGPPGGGPSGDGGTPPPSAGGGAGAAGAASATAGKTAAVAIAALLAGGGIGAAISELRPRGDAAHRDVAAVAAADAASEVAAPMDASEATTIAPDASNAAPSDEPRSHDAGAPRSAPHDAGVRALDASTAAADDLARERALIDVARSALRSGDLPLATRSLVEHGLRFPHGALVEEQRVLAIELAVAKGDRASATTQAAAFRRDYPRSVFRGRVDQLAP